jgi:hypothetical protein
MYQMNAKLAGMKLVNKDVKRMLAENAINMST